MGRRALSLLLAAAALCAVAGCGLGPGSEKEGGGAQLRVTRDFGQKELSHASAARVRDGQTVMRFLRSSSRVTTRYGGGFVQSVDGLAGKGGGGGQDWFFYVNGIGANRGAADYDLHPGDVVQWDYRYWKAAQDVRAIVGSYPEPFVHGLDGKRLPVRVECEDAERGPCDDVKKALGDVGAAASGAALGTSGTRDVARVVVGRWAAVRQLPTVKAIERGPRRSGVFARYAGNRLQLLDEQGRLKRTAGPDTGLVAALRPTDEALVWVVTGGNDAGVRNAARALRPADLRDAFAVAAPPGGPVAPLPLGAGR